jgi:UDP-2,3-diacylglucosamine pyrophosphatase LpxH
VKGKVKRAVQYVGDFENAVAREAARRGMQGVICGHIHRAAMHEIQGVLYCNTGDWVESCTALVERNDGVLELLALGSSAQPAGVLFVAGSVATG